MADILNYNDVRISELDSYLFGQGTHYEIYNKMGAHVAQKDGKTGVYFAVWAPAAKDVYVIGEFNDWKAYGYDMKKISDGGIYELFVEGAMKGQMYKYLIIAQNGEAIYKADPYANAAQLRPETASIVADLNSFTWTDSAWVESKKKENHLKSPMSIYECHLGSWKKQEDGTEDGYINYRDIAPDLAAYVSEMGYTHIELMVLQSILSMAHGVIRLQDIMHLLQDTEHQRTSCISLIICTANILPSYLTGFLHIFQRMHMVLPTSMEAVSTSMQTLEKVNILTGALKYLIMVRMKYPTSLLQMVCSG